MVKPLTLVVVAMLLAPARPVVAQPPPPPPAPPAEQEQEKPPADQKREKPPPPPPAPLPGAPPGLAVAPGEPPHVGPNVRVEVTLSEQNAGASPLSKTVTITTSSGRWGRVRTAVSSAALPGPSLPLNVDVNPTAIGDGEILLDLRVEYQQRHSPEGGQWRQSVLNESVTVRLRDGQPLDVARSAEAGSDRSVSLQVKATVLD